MPDRIYSPEEVTAIIERVAERQRAGLDVEGPEGLTLVEIERACRAAGLDPALVSAAAQEVDASGPALVPTTSLTSVAEVWVDGALTGAAWEDVVDQLRLRYGAPAGTGEARVGDGREWTHSSTSGTRWTVTASPRGDRVRVRVIAAGLGIDNARVEGLLIAGFVGIVPAMLLGALVAESIGLGDLWGVLTVALVLIASLAVGATVVPPWLLSKRQEQARETRALADDVAEWIAGNLSAPEAAPEAADVSADPQARLDLDALGDAPSTEVGDVVPRRTRS